MSKTSHLVLNFARGGRTVHTWDWKPHPHYGMKLVPLCGKSAVPADSRYITDDDKQCPKCVELARQRIGADAISSA